jgi:hypothetical protein
VDGNRSFVQLNPMRTFGWSWKLAPTPGRSTSTSIPAAFRTDGGPIPLRCRICGLCNAPAQRMVSTSALTSSTPSSSEEPRSCMRIPVTLFSLSRSNSFTRYPVIRSRLVRLAMGSKYPVLAYDRVTVRRSMALCSVNQSRPQQLTFSYPYFDPK